MEDLNTVSSYTKCFICNSSNLSSVYYTYDRHYGNINKSYNVDQCKDCKLLFLNPMITGKELHSLYDDDTYYAYQPFEIDEKPTIMQKTARKLINIKAGDPKFESNGKQILDIGCGSGRELYFYKKDGAFVTGVEISKSGAEFGNKFGLNIFNGTLIEANLPNDKFDYIRSNHSFEHLVNPIETTEEIFRITKSGGLVFIGVPNADSLPYRLFKKYWYYLGVPFHP